MSKAPRPLTVLLAEDEVLIRTMLARVLERRGLRVRLASDGLEAVRIFRESAETMDAIVIDVRMPGLDGQKALAEMRALRPKVPAILMSGHDLPPGELGALQESVRFMVKPFSGAMLAQAIQEMTSSVESPAP